MHCKEPENLTPKVIADLLAQLRTTDSTLKKVTGASQDLLRFASYLLLSGKIEEDPWLKMML